MENRIWHTWVIAGWFAFYPLLFKLTEARADAIVNQATEGQAFGADLLLGAGALPSVETGNPGAGGHTDADAFYIREMLPGSSIDGYEELRQTYDNPDRLRDLSQQAVRDVRGNGCPVTELRYLETASVLTVTALRRELVQELEGGVPKVDASGDPVYVYSDSPGMFNGSLLSMGIPTIGAADIWDEVIVPPRPGTPGLVYRFRSEPFAAPLDGTYFTYNHRLTTSDIPGTIDAYGSLSDGWATQGTLYPILGGQLTLDADLYRADREYIDPAELGGTCPNDPPGCTVGPIELCGGPGAGVMSVYNQGQSHQADAYGLLLTGHLNNPATPYDAELAEIASNAFQFASTGVSTVFAGCTENAEYTFEAVTAHYEDILTCHSILVDLEQDGCQGQRTTRFTYRGDQQVYRLSAAWAPRNCVAEGIAEYNTCSSTCATNANDTYSACTTSCSDAAATIYNDCLDGGGTVDFCLTEQANHLAACSGDCDAERILALDACTPYCEQVQSDYVAACNAWNASHADQPYDLTGRLFDIGAYTVGTVTERTWEEPVPPGRVLFREEVTAFPGNPSSTFTYAHTLINAAGAIDSFGSQGDGWTTIGTASPNGSEFSISAQAYDVLNNDIDGCNNYIAYIADGMCQGEITCTDQRGPCTVLDGVSFCEGAGPAAGVAELLPQWGPPVTALRPTTDACASGEPVGEGELLLNQLCWAAEGAPMVCDYMVGDMDCYTDAQGELICDSTTGEGLGQDFSAQGYLDDCASKGFLDRPDCTLVSTTECTDCATGAISGICYVRDVKFDCGESFSATVPATATFTQQCGSPIRCMGTECHNPVVEVNEDFDKVIAATTMIDVMRNEMICSETGEAPTSPSELCTPILFDGEKQKCKVPIGHSVGLTPNCCDAGREAAAGIDAIAYLQLVWYGYKLSNVQMVQNALAGTSVLPGITEAIGGAGNAIDGAISATLQPIESAFSGLMTDISREMGIEALEQTGQQIAEQGLIKGIEQQLLGALNDFLVETFGAEFAGQIVTQEAGKYVLGTALQAIMIAYMVYQILQILGHLIFKCSEDELRLGIDRKVGNCHYVGDYCSKKALLIGCIVTKSVFCCYKSPLARIVASQLKEDQGIGGGYGKPKQANCDGFTLAELESANWDAIDLSEWIARLAEAGILPEGEAEIESMWGLNHERSLLVTGRNAAFGTPETEQGRIAYTVEPNTAQIVSQRNQLKSMPVCFDPDDPERMAWYGKLEGPDLSGGGTTFVPETETVTARYRLDIPDDDIAVRIDFGAGTAELVQWAITWSIPEYSSLIYEVPAVDYASWCAPGAEADVALVSHNVWSPWEGWWGHLERQAPSCDNGLVGIYTRSTGTGWDEVPQASLFATEAHFAFTRMVEVTLPPSSGDPGTTEARLFDYDPAACYVP